jgi:hypothetical protein
MIPGYKGEIGMNGTKKFRIFVSVVCFLPVFLFLLVACGENVNQPVALEPAEEAAQTSESENSDHAPEPPEENEPPKLITEQLKLEFEQLYLSAVEALGWLEMDSSPLLGHRSWQQRDYWVEHAGMTFFRVEHPEISSFADFITWFEQSFTPELTAEIIERNSNMLHEADGILYIIDGARGGNMFAGDELHEIHQINEENMLLRVIVDMGEWDFDENEQEWTFLPEYQVTHDFYIVLTDNGWRFTNFALVR